MKPLSWLFAGLIAVTIQTDSGTYVVDLPERPIAASRLGDGALLLSFKNRKPLIFKDGKLKKLDLKSF